MVYRLPLTAFFFALPISISEDMRNHFLHILNGGYYLYAKKMKLYSKHSQIQKFLKVLLEKSIDLPKKYDKIKEIGGFLSYLPEKDCFLLYKITIDKKSESLFIEFSGFGDPKINLLNVYKQICEELVEDIEFYLCLKNQIK